MVISSGSLLVVGVHIAAHKCSILRPVLTNKKRGQYKLFLQKIIHHQERVILINADYAEDDNKL